MVRYLTRSRQSGLVVDFLGLFLLERECVSESMIYLQTLQRDSKSKLSRIDCTNRIYLVRKFKNMPFATSAPQRRRELDRRFENVAIRPHQRNLLESPSTGGIPTTSCRYFCCPPKKPKICWNIATCGTPFNQSDRSVSQANDHNQELAPGI